MSTMTASRTSSNLAPIQHASAKMIAQAEASKKPMETIVEDGKVDMRLLMIALWKNRKNQQFTEELCEQLSHLVITKPALDQVEFYLPQLAHMVVHLEKELPIDAMEQFVMLLSQSSVHFALQFFWIIYASLDENRPKRNGNPRTFARCAQLLLALEQCLIYGSPVAREVSELLTKHSISKAEMEQILMADRRFFAAQSSMSEISYDDVPEGWLLKKGGGTSRMGRRSWKLRWCRIERRIMLIYSRQTDIHPRAAVPLDRAEIHVVENPKHPFYFEIAHRFSETKFKFAAQNHEEMVQWIRNIQKAAAVPDPPATSPTRRAGPARTLVRMTDAMRSFILQDSNQCSTGPGSPLPVAPSLSSPTSIKNRSGALSQSSSTGGISAEALVERLHAVISPGKISSMSVSVATSEQTEMTLTDNSWDEDMLPSDQQRRYEFFSDFINFIKSITDVSEEMRHIEPSQRKALLCPKLEKLIIPSKGYIPLCKSTDVSC
jgi:phosphatidylinositol 4-kinase